MEAELVLETMLQRYRLSLGEGQNIKLNPLVTLRPEPDIQMRIERRKDVVEAEKVAVEV